MLFNQNNFCGCTTLSHTDRYEGGWHGSQKGYDITFRLPMLKGVQKKQSLIFTQSFTVQKKKTYIAFSNVQLLLSQSPEQRCEFVLEIPSVHVLKIKKKKQNLQFFPITSTK